LQPEPRIAEHGRENHHRAKQEKRERALHWVWVRYPEACFGLDRASGPRILPWSACVSQAALGVSPRASAARRRRRHARRVRSTE
jgi:hypothetical protein